MKNRLIIKRIEFMPEADKVLFYPINGFDGFDVGDRYFNVSITHEASQTVCIVQTEALQQAGWSLDLPLEPGPVEVVAPDDDEV